ncbi:carbohydrate porin [Vibrio barjaei]|jgi:maltoporin|uniref:carbohydrate porin n=1 Tax=Vibrio barjaei TaxID=1676683 RepID=UPI002283DD79|nr:carbohydrate porin [Vibrio barjaei]MCY9872446.1 carbohydrate porin [Vibrio barjaei]
MKKVSVIAAAVVGVLGTGTVSAADVDFHGYMRAGFGANMDGGSQFCYGNGGPAAHVVGRLGDECDVYAELSLSANNVWEGDDGQAFNIHTLVAYGSVEDGGLDGRGNSFQSIGTDATDPWSGGRAAFREAWADYKMSNGMSLWAGNRYYGRKDVHIQDFYYINNSGNGVGVENIDLGPGKFHAAVVQHKWKAPQKTDNPNYNPSNPNDAQHDPSKPFDDNKYLEPLESTQLYSTSNTIDLRYTGLETNTNGSLEFIVLAGKPSYTDEQKNAIATGTGNVGDYGLDEIGYSATIEHTQGNFFGGFNKAVIQYSTEGYAWAGYGVNNHLGDSFNMEQGQKGRKAWRFIDWGVIEQEKWNLGYSFIYSQLENGDGKKGTRASVVLRPSYKWSDTMSTVLEGGYYVQDDPWMNESQDLNKITIAQQWQAGSNFWARPAIRIFASMYGGDQVQENNDKMIGAQVEAWW